MSDGVRDAFKKRIKATWNPKGGTAYEVDPSETPMIEARKGKIRRPEKMKNPPKQESWL